MVSGCGHFSDSKPCRLLNKNGFDHIVSSSEEIMSQCVSESEAQLSLMMIIISDLGERLPKRESPLFKDILLLF